MTIRTDALEALVFAAMPSVKQAPEDTKGELLSIFGAAIGYGMYVMEFEPEWGLALNRQLWHDAPEELVEGAREELKRIVAAHPLSSNDDDEGGEQPD